MAPAFLSSCAIRGSTTLIYRVRFFALSAGTFLPQLSHWTFPALPFEPPDLPPVRLFFVIKASPLEVA